MLLNQQSIRIAEFNVQSLQNVLIQFREFFAEERIDLLQVVQAENRLYSAQQGLLISKVAYENSLDQYKRDLGLPPDVPVRIQDPYLDRFELISDQLLARQLQITALRDEIGGQLERINPYTIDETGREITSVQWNDDLKGKLESLEPYLKLMEPLFQAMQESDVELIRRDFERMRQARPERLRKLANLREYVATSDIEFDIEPAILRDDVVESADRLENELKELLIKFTPIRESLEALRANIARLLVEGPALDPDDLRKRMEAEILFETPEILTRVANVAIELNLLQARARVDSITLPDVDISAREAFAIALQFRRDLMNARAALVDRWRRIEFVADDLEGVLDLEVNGSFGTLGDNENPFKVRWDSNQFNFGFRFDAPITRLTERNRYREALIEYQRARRQYYNFEDSINQNLRRTLRALEQSRVLFQLSRRSIRTAIQQVELSQFALVEPARPGQGGVGGSTLGPTAQRDLTNALDDLQRTQTEFVGIWVDYESLRRGLDFDMGTMQLSPEGVWMDPGTINVNYAWRAAAVVGIPPEDLCLPPREVSTDELDQYDLGPAATPGEPPDYIVPPETDTPAAPRPDPARPLPGGDQGRLEPASGSDADSADLGPRLGFVPQWLRDRRSSSGDGEIGPTRK